MLRTIVHRSSSSFTTGVRVSGCLAMMLRDAPFLYGAIATVELDGNGEAARVPPRNVALALRVGLPRFPGVGPDRIAPVRPKPTDWVRKPTRVE